MLLGNYSILNSNCGREIGINGASNIFTYYKDSTIRSFYTGSHVVAGQTSKANFPTGTQPPNSYVMAFKGGELSATTKINQLSNFTADLIQGVNISTSDLNGIGTITSAELSLVVQLACNILGSANLAADLSGKVEMAAALAGSGDLTASLSLLAELTTSIIGANTLTAGMYGTADLAADITSSSTLSPENLAAAVWNSVAAAFNTAGTMGNKMNSAASAGDPWSTNLPASYTGTQAGAILSEIETLVERLHRLGRLDPLNPLTVTPTSMDAGDIHIDITGDGETSSTFTATS